MEETGEEGFSSSRRCAGRVKRESDFQHWSWKDSNNVPPAHFADLRYAMDRKMPFNFELRPEQIKDLQLKMNSELHTELYRKRIPDAHRGMLPELRPEMHRTLIPEMIREFRPEVHPELRRKTCSGCAPELGGGIRAAGTEAGNTTEAGIVWTWNSEAGATVIPRWICRFGRKWNWKRKTNRKWTVPRSRNIWEIHPSPSRRPSYEDTTAVDIIFNTDVLILFVFMNFLKIWESIFINVKH